MGDGEARDTAGTMLRSGGPAASSPPGGVSWRGVGAEQSGRRGVSSQAEEVLLPVALLPGDRPLSPLPPRDSRNTNTNPVPAPARPGCPHAGPVAVPTPLARVPPQWQRSGDVPTPSGGGRRGVGARSLSRSVWVVWLSGVKPPAWSPLGSTHRIQRRVPPAGAGAGQWYVPS